MKGKQSIYSRNSDREWIPITRHRAGAHNAPNAIHIGDGYIAGTNGLPKPVIRWVRADGTEKGRYIGGFEPTMAYEENDELHVRVADLNQLSTLYVRYNQIKEILIDVGLLTRARALGFRRNYITNFGVVDLSNCPDMFHIDFSDNSSVTELILNPNSPINFFYMQGTGISQANIDYLLQHAVNSGILNGTLTYSNRPSYDAWDNYDLLASRGWNLSLSPVAGTIEKLGDTNAGLSNGELIGGSHRVTFRAMNANGTVRHEGAFSSTHLGDLPDFEENGWIETEYYHPSILRLTVRGKQLKTLYLDHLVNLVEGDFGNNNFQSVSAVNITNLERLNIENTPVASLAGMAVNPIKYLNITGTNLGTSAIDALMADLVTAGQLDGTFLYDLQPSSAAAADYDTLVSRGWFLSIEPDRTLTELPAGDYYVSALGNDANDGSHASPWKTLDKVNSVKIAAGVSTTSTVSFRYGDTFTGSLNVTSEGVIYKAYGDNALPKPIISSGNNNGAFIRNLAGVEIGYLHFKGSGSSLNQGYGIQFLNDLAGDTKLTTAVVSNCVVEGYKYNGVLIEGANGSSGFHDIGIISVTVRDILRNGIEIKGAWSATKTTYAHSNAYVSGCVVSECHGDANVTDTHTGSGIILSDIDTGFIGECIAHTCAENMNWSSGGAVGIWFWDSNKVKIVDCEAYNISSGLTNKDGAGFDLDGGVTNGIIERCYSHDNDGAGFMAGQFGGSRALGNIAIRNNISINDAKTYASSLFLFSGDTNVGRIDVYNNVFFQTDQTKSVYSSLVYGGGNLGTTVLRNNAFIGATEAFTGVTQNNNWLPANGDPKFVNPTALTPEGLKIQSDSPLVNAGAAITDLAWLETAGFTTENDYFGTAITADTNRDIGAHQTADVTAGTVEITNPSEGENTTASVLATFNDNEATTVNITSPTEGATTASNIKITFNG